jgi:hypothetical protein
VTEGHGARQSLGSLAASLKRPLVEVFDEILKAPIPEQLERLLQEMDAPPDKPPPPGRADTAT